MAINENDQSKPPSLKLAELNAIAVRCANRPILSQLTDDEILGYPVPTEIPPFDTLPANPLT